MRRFLRISLPALALLSLVATAQAQTQPDDHQAHHPAGQAEQTQPAPGPGPSPAQGMGQGMGMMGGAGGMPMGCPMMDQAQAGAPGRMAGNMPMMPMMRQGGMGMPFEHIEGRIAFLKAEIGITADQAAAWDAFANALRQSAGAHRSMHERMMGTAASPPSSWPERLERHAQAMSARAEAFKAVGKAAKPLYDVLSEEQRRKAETLLSGPMGMM